MSIAVQDVRWSTGGKLVLDSVSLSIERGKTLGLLGPNGSGKSSLLRLICGLRRLTSGVVTLDGGDIKHLSRRNGPPCRLRRSACHDGRPVTVLDVVRLGRTPHRGPLAEWTSQDEAAVIQALNDVGLGTRAGQR